eukprot:1008500-Alexandrium_andersonii.AAC.1
MCIRDSPGRALLNGAGRALLSGAGRSRRSRAWGLGGRMPIGRGAAGAQKSGSHSRPPGRRAFLLRAAPVAT